MDPHYPQPQTQPPGAPAWAPPPQPPAAAPPPQPPPPRRGFDLIGFITFRQMITPGLITVIWVLGVIGITIAALVTLDQNALGAVLLWIVGNLYLRVILELMIVLFRIYDRLGDIERRGRGM